MSFDDTLSVHLFKGEGWGILEAKKALAWDGVGWCERKAEEAIGRGGGGNRA